MQPLDEEARIVVIGAGQAGGWAAQTLRAEGFGGRITLIGDESHRPHERPPLSKAVLSGAAGVESCYLAKPEVFDALRLDWRPGTRVARIDRAGNEVQLEGGERLAYDRLILCTGGRARGLPMPVAPGANVHALRTVEDAERLAAELCPGARVAVIGGGWIGLEVAAMARQKGAEVTVIEAQARLCQRAVPEDVSAFLHELHPGQGVELLLGQTVEAVDADAEGRTLVRLAGRLPLVCDVLVAGIGLVPNDELARAAGLDCAPGGGVLVDGACRSSDERIFAAGDVAVAANPWAPQDAPMLRLESWQNAQDQGIAAARAALGMEVHYQPLPWFWSDQYGVNLQIYGLPRAGHRLVRRRLGERSFVHFYLEGDVVQAAVAANAARELRFARRLMEQRRSVADAVLADVGVALSKL